jgi:SAM-dependent methyltransferase
MLGPAFGARLPFGQPARGVAPAKTTRARPPVATQVERRRIMTEGIDLGGLGLEIGPSHRPLLAKRDGYNIRTADHLDQAGLIAKYDGVRETSTIEEVDYVVTGSRLTTSIPDTFDYIVGSHVLEHTVCLVSFLQDASTLLKPGGVLSLAVPDRRFCFDRFRERSSLARVLEIYRAAPSVHSEGAVIDFYLNVVRKGDSISWYAGAPGEYANANTYQEMLDHAAEARRGEYVDVHNWLFTPHHFRLLIEDLHTLGLIELREASFHDTWGSEFYVTLSREGRGPDVDRHELMRRSAEEAGVPDGPRFEAAGAGVEPAVVRGDA